jgi:uncharacterized membrane protein YdjX (TVP38/TMEM64 family)
VPHHPLHHRRIVLLVALIAIVIAVASSDAVHQAFVDVLAAAERLMSSYPRAGMAVFIALSALSAMLSFFSSSALVPFGVFVWGPTSTMLMLWSGGVLGGIAGYWMARTLGRGIVQRIVPEGPFQRYEEFFRTRASWHTVLLFRIALQSELPSYVLGVLRYPFMRYLPMILLGEIPFVLFAVYLGESMIERNAWVFAIALLTGVTLTLIAFRALQRQMRAT